MARRARQNAKRAERYHANWQAENYARYKRRLRARIAFKGGRLEELLASIPDTDVWRDLKQRLSEDLRVGVWRADALAPKTGA